MQRWLLSFGLVATVAMGCAPRRSASTAAPPGCEAGDATYYADSLAGRATASGEPYDPHAKTAAHRTLKLGSWVRIRWRDRETIVRVNDRGPFGRKGVVDLSRAAAEELGMLRAGRVPVTVCPI